MAIRKDANTLSTAERAEFVAAVLEVKRQGIYDQFVLRHANAIMSAIHRAPAFLPWHRRFIWDLEQELQRVSGNPDLALPYWNWPEGDENASMWDADLLGGNGDPVTQAVQTGPFRQGQWSVVNRSGTQTGPLERAFGRNTASLPTQAQVDQVMAVTPYDSAPWQAGASPSFRDQIEGWTGPNLHNRGHVWVGGSMLPMTSPNDPAFFLHHCMVDKVWHDWQRAFPNQGYLPQSGGPFGQNLNDPMDSTPTGPIGARPVDVLDNAAIDVEYDTDQAQGPVVTAPEELTVNGSPLTGSIDVPGELKAYSFSVAAFGAHTVETTGSSDTVMTLSGPDNPSAQIAENDDGGQNFNSRISMNLSVGEYTARVRLFSANRTGGYSIGVSAAPTGPVIPTLVVNGPVVDAAISAGSESDLYRFQTQSQGNYVIETSGPTDTFLTLFGPNSQTAQIAQNDDAGFRFNARITASLAGGEYFVRVRHFSSLGTGPYQISVRRL